MERGDIVVVFGGRTYANANYLNAAMDAFHRNCPIRLLIEGGAPGADHHAKQWAIDRGVPHITCRADWQRMGKSAGPKRNREMAAAKPDWAVAFPGGNGTKDMFDVCEQNQIEVVDHRLERFTPPPRRRGAKD